MEGWNDNLTVALIVAVVCIIMSTSIKWITEAVLKKKQAQLKENSEAREELKLKKMGDLVRQISKEEISIGIRPTNDKVDALNAKVEQVSITQGQLVADTKLLKGGQQASLRDDINIKFSECMKKGYTTEADRRNMNNMYKFYEKLGGNGAIEELIKKFNGLPYEEEYQRAKKKTKTNKAKATTKLHTEMVKES